MGSDAVGAWAVARPMGVVSGAFQAARTGSTATAWEYRAPDMSGRGTGRGR
jgi:hypothetical protein